MRKTALFFLYIMGFAFALRSALPSYINSTFLSDFLGERLVGLVFVFCSIVTIFGFVYMPRILKKYGNYKTTIAFSTINLFSLIGLAFLQNINLILFCFLVNYVMGTLLILCIDVFVEHNSINKDTGKIRSFYLTAVNIAWLMSPWLTGVVLGDGDYWKVYFVSSLIMIVIIFMVSYNLNSFKDQEYKEFKPIPTIKEIYKNKDIKCILASSFLLQFFYAWMIIYTPIYLVKYVGFDWQTLGVIFTIMLLPFIFVEIPLGKIADKYIGEKEMLNIGFVITIFSVALMPFISGKDFWLWAILLFVTRIGAAMIEVMTETYFFKKISDKDVNLISIFRSMSTIAYIIAPIIVTISLVLLPFCYTFFVLAAIMVFGFRYSLAIKDTK